MNDNTDVVVALLQMPLILAELIFACYGIWAIAHRDFESGVGCFLITVFLGWVMRQIGKTAVQVKANENL